VWLGRYEGSKANFVEKSFELTAVTKYGGTVTNVKCSRWWEQLLVHTTLDTIILINNWIHLYRVGQKVTLLIFAITLFAASQFS